MKSRGGRIFLVAYDFPPRVRSGSYRPNRFASALSSRGRDVVVLTAKESKDARGLDLSLLRERDQKVFVKSVFSPSSLLEPLQARLSRAGIGGLIYHMRKMLLFPDEKILWALSVAFLLYRWKPQKGDIIITSSPPWSAHLIGLVFRRLRDVRWIADHRDAWTQNPHFREKGKTARKLHRYMERLCHSISDSVITASRGQKENLIRSFGIEEKKVLALYSGFDEKDYEKARRRGGKKLKKGGKGSADQFVICYAGAFYEDYFPGPFLDALSLLASQEPDLRERVRVLFFLSAGKERLEEAAERSGLRDIVAVESAIDHSEVPACLLAADALLLFVPSTGGSGAWVPGKTFEYIGSGKPVLAVVPPDGEAAGLVREYGRGVIADPRDPASVKEALVELMRGEVGSGRGRGDVTELGWNSLKAQLVELVETISPYEGAEAFARRPVSVALASSGLGIVDRGVERFTEELGRVLSADFNVSVYGGGNGANHTRIPCVSRNNRLAVNIMKALPRALQRLLKRLHLDPCGIEKLTFSLGMLLAIRGRNHDVLVQSVGFWGAVVSNLAKKLYGLKVISVGHGGLGGAVEELSVPSDYYVTLNPAIVEELKDRFPARRITLLPTLVDTSRFKPGRSRLDLALERPVYIVVGALEPEKRIDLAVKAVARLKRGSLLVLGSGPLEDEITELGQIELGKGRFMLDCASKEAMVDYYNMADVFTLPSLREAFPLAVLEAMSCNLPVVTVREGARALLGNGSIDYCEPEDETAYSRALARASRRKPSGKSRRRAEEFDCGRAGKRWGNLIREVVGG